MFPNKYSHVSLVGDLKGVAQGPASLILGKKNHRRMKSQQVKQPSAPLAHGLDPPLITYAIFWIYLTMWHHIMLLHIFISLANCWWILV